MAQRLRILWLRAFLNAFMLTLSVEETPEHAVTPFNKELHSFTKDPQPVDKDLHSFTEDHQPVTEAIQPVNENLQPVNENLQPDTEVIQPVSDYLYLYDEHDYNYDEDRYRFDEHLRPFDKDPNPFDDVHLTSDKVLQPVDKDVHPLNKYLIPDCNMTRYDSRKLYVSDDPFEPVIQLFSTSSITMKTKDNELVQIDLLDIPKHLPMASRFDLKSETFTLNIPPFETADLIFNDVNDTEGLNSSSLPIEMTFGNVVMTAGNCTTGLPYYPADDIYAPTFTNMGRIEIILISNREYGISDISGFMKGGEGFSICSDGGRPTVRRKWTHSFDECRTIQNGVPLYLTLSRDSKKNRTNINGVWLRDTKGAVEFFDGDFTTVYCLHGCPTLSEFNGTQGNATKKAPLTCVFDTRTYSLVVAVAVVLLILMALDVAAMIADVIRRRFFNHPPQQDPVQLQWHLITRPLPWAWQIPPPLPEQPPPGGPGLPQDFRRRQVGEEGEGGQEEEQEEEEEGD